MVLLTGKEGGELVRRSQSVFLAGGAGWVFTPRVMISDVSFGFGYAVFISIIAFLLLLLLLYFIY